MAVANPPTLLSICSELRLYGASERSFRSAVEAVTNPSFFAGKSIASMKAWAGYVDAVPITVTPSSAELPGAPDSAYPVLSKSFTVQTVGAWSFDPPIVHLQQATGPLTDGWLYEKVSDTEFRVTMSIRPEGDSIRKYGTAHLFTPSGGSCTLSLIQQGNPEIPD